MTKQRKFLPTIADLIDVITVDQIKELKFPRNKRSYSNEMEKVAHDIDLVIANKKIKLSARLIRMIIILAQTNLHIWNNKEAMKQYPDKYLDHLKVAHQLNGIRNRMKNLILEECGYRQPSLRRTNVETDDLESDVSLK